MNGNDYVATKRLSLKDDTELAVPGERCGKVPAASLPWLIEQKLVVPAPPPQPNRTPVAAKKKE